MSKLRGRSMPTASGGTRPMAWGASVLGKTRSAPLLAHAVSSAVCPARPNAGRSARARGRGPGLHGAGCAPRAVSEAGYQFESGRCAAVQAARVARARAVALSAACWLPGEGTNSPAAGAGAGQGAPLCPRRRVRAARSPLVDHMIGPSRSGPSCPASTRPNRCLRQPRPGHKKEGYVAGGSGLTRGCGAENGLHSSLLVPGGDLLRAARHQLAL